MPGQPKDLFDALRAHHLPLMKEQHKRLLVMLAAGRPRDEIAKALDASPSTVQRWIDLVTAEITSQVECGEGSLAEVRGAWTMAHLDCCLASGRAA